MAATKRSYEAFHNQPGAVFIPFWLLGLILIAIILLAVAIVAYVIPRGTALDRGNAALVKAFSKRRVIEPRLAGGFLAGNFNPAREDETGINKSALETATDSIHDALRTEDPNAHLAYGRLLLCKANKTKDALKQLRLAVKWMPDSADSHNDLGAGLFDSGKLEDALDEFNLALERKADMPEALFNRALCYERLLLRGAASEEYTRLMAIDGDRGWLNEARQRQQQVSAPLAPLDKQADIVTIFHSALDRNDLEEAKRIIDGNVEVIVKHSSRACVIEYLKEAVAGNDEKAQRELSEIDFIGNRLVDARGDKLIADLSAYLHNLPAGERQTELGLISDFIEAEKLQNVRKYLDAQGTFERLKVQFADRGNNLFQTCSTFNLAGCLYGTGQLISSIDTLKDVLAISEQNSWSYLRALTMTQLGAGHSRRGNDSLAIKYFEKSLELTRDMYITEASTNQFMTIAYDNLGDVDNKLACLRKSTNLYLASIPTLNRVASNYSSIAELYSLRGNHSLALMYAKEALKVSNQANDPNRAAQVLSLMAVEYARTNQVKEAEESLSRAFVYQQENGGDQASYTAGLIRRRAGDMAAQLGDAGRSVDFYSKAEELVKQCEDVTVPMIRVLRGRAEAYMKAKQFDQARQDLDHAIKLIEDYRSNITERKSRSDFHGDIQGVFDAMIMLNANSGEKQPLAFNYSEQSRARTLLDDLSHPQSADAGEGNVSLQKKSAGSSPARGPADPLTLPEVQAALPDNLRLITYTVTSQGTLIFLMTRSGFEAVESPATAERLDNLVQDYVSGLKEMTSLDDLSEKARSLYRYLVEPVASRLRDGKRLCIVPDKALHFLPFAALIDESNKYLLESYSITYAPSASVLVQCIKEAQNKGAVKNEKILAVGNPSFNQDKFPSLKGLPEAEREATELALLYSERNVLNREKATKPNLRAGLIDCEVAHFSLHCLVEGNSPWLAALVLAEPGPEAAAQSQAESSLLYLGDIYGMILPRVRLVVLSACQSGLGQYYRGEGIVSLVRPFLALRVPTVVASLWSVDSQATASLMIDFHRQRKTKNPEAGDALRAAQIKMVRSDSYQHPYFWAPFIAVGNTN